MSQPETSGNIGLPATPGQLMEIVDEAAFGSSFAAFNRHMANATDESLVRAIMGTGFIPGNLQTEDYMSELLISYGGNEEDRIRGMRIRAGRGALLLASEANQEYRMPLSSLYSPIDKISGRPRTSDTTMHRQLGHILNVAGSGSQVSVRLAPDMAVSKLGGVSTDLFYPAGEAGTLYVSMETTSAQRMLSEEGGADMVSAWEELENSLLTPEESRRLIENRWAELRP